MAKTFAINPDKFFRVRLKHVRGSFLHLFRPQEGKVDPETGKRGKDKYNGSFILELPEHDETLDMLRETARKVAVAKWGDTNGEKHFKAISKANKLFLHDGDEKPDLQGYEGNFYFNASNASRPSVYDRYKSPDGKPIKLTDEDSARIYSGCYLDVIIEIWAQDDKEYGKRINASLAGVQFNEDGDALAGTQAAGDDEFEYEEANEMEEEDFV